MGEGFASYSSATSTVPEGAAASATATIAATATATTATPPAAAAAAPSFASASAASTAASAAGATATAAAAAAAAATPSAAAAAAPAGGGGDELVDVLLSADGNYVQELLLEEAAKLADAAVRESLGKAGSSSLAAGLADALQAPKRLGSRMLGALPLPDGLRDGLLLPATVLDDLSRLVPSLSRTERTDEQSLAAFGELWDQLSPPSPQIGDEGAAAAVSGGGAARRAAASAPCRQQASSEMGRCSPGTRR